MAYKPYDPATVWKFTNKQSRVEKLETLELSWEVSGDPISDDYTPDEISAAELYEMWQEHYVKDGRAGIIWYVAGELAPFQESYYQEIHGKEPEPIFGTVAPHEDFLTYFTWPVDAVTGEPLNWLRLPVKDKLWNAKHADKGGFIQELTSWKPSPFERVFRADIIGRAVSVAW